MDHVFTFETAAEPAYFQPSAMLAYPTFDYSNSDTATAPPNMATVTDNMTTETGDMTMVPTDMTSLLRMLHILKITDKSNTIQRRYLD